MATNPNLTSIPNLLTYGRIVAIPRVIVLLLVAGSPTLRWIALILYLAAAISDFLDGYLARKWQQGSELGRMLDPIADKLLVGALIVVFAWDRSLAAWDLIPALAILLREIFVSGLREYLGPRNIVVKVTQLAKWKTTVQLLALAFIFLVPLLGGTGLVAELLLWLAGVLTLITGTQYFLGAWPYLLGRHTVKILYFAWLRERLNKDEEEVAPPAEIVTVGDLIAWLKQNDEAAALAMADPALIRAAVDARLVGPDAPIAGAAVVALFPPMTRGLSVAIRIDPEPFDPGAEANTFLAAANGAGAAVTFTGLVRSLPDAPVATLTLECYPELALTQIGSMIAEAVARFGLLDATVIHRYGPLAAGEPIVQVMALAPHRQAAFAGTEFLMDYLKTDAPFWKKETSPGGNAHWVEPHAEDDAARARWSAEPAR